MHKGQAMVSSKDVARLAGVSQATVSRVLNNPTGVRHETREKVLKAMEQLHYKPNLIARSLITKSTKLVALISGSLSNGFFVETTDSIVQLLMRHGYKTIVFFDGTANLKDILDSVLSNRVDGILMSSIKLEDPLFDGILASGIPYVFFNRRPRTGGNYVVLDNELAGRLIAQHLLDLGHERVAYVSGPANISTFLERFTGFKTAMEVAGAVLDSEMVMEVDASSPEEVEKATWKLLNRDTPPSAVVYATDAMALIGMDVAMSMGYRIPEDVSVAGMDDIKMAAHAAIQLTTVRHHRFTMGEIAAEMLIDMMEKCELAQSPRQIVLKPELVVRKTTARRRL
ncbi:MAG: LacI family transcriptional regulator [Alicyclobacillus macrosporangiidus]|nr:LacI family transcriptional regulator [Alicyclobacillus macrosporangiidus]